MHIATEEALAQGPKLAQELVALSRADAALDDVSFAASPAWFSAKETAHIDWLAAALQKVMDRLPDALVSHAAIRRTLTPCHSDLRWAEAPHGRRSAVAVAAWSGAMRWCCAPGLPSSFVRVRPDGYWIDNRLRMFEINDGMMGSHQVDALARMLLGHDRMRSLLEDKVPARSSSALAEALLARSRALLPGLATRVGVFVSPAGPNLTHQSFAAALRATGVPVVPVGPWDLQWRGGWLVVHGERITLALDQGRPRALPQFPAAARLLAKARLSFAYRQRAAWVHPAPYEWLASKALVALLSDGSFDGLLPEPELSRVKEHLAWTRLTRPGLVRWLDGSTQPLRQLCERKQGDLVLKPAFGDAGKGVYLGDAVDKTAWRRSLDLAFANGDHVIQERLRPDPVKVVLCTPTLDKTRVIHDVCPVIIDGKVAAVWCRFSSSSMTGIDRNELDGTAVYGFVPTWLSRPRGNRETGDAA